MAHYRKIDVQIWNDAAFQSLWEQRFKEPVSVPTSLSNPRAFFSEKEREARSKRCWFAKRKKALFLQVSSLRGGAFCGCCGAVSGLVIDHIIPIRWGGTNDIANMQILCSACNSAKGGKLPEPPAEVCDGR